MATDPRQRLLTAGAVVAAVATLAIAGRVVAVPPRSAPPRSPHAVRADLPRVGTMSAVVGSVELPGPLVSLAYDGRSVWGADFDDGLVVRVDPTTMRVVTRIQEGHAQAGPWHVAVGDGTVWALSWGGKVLRVEGATGRPLAHLSLRGRVEGQAIADGALWLPCCGVATDDHRGVVVKVPLATGRVAARIPIAGQPGRVAAGAGAVWVLDGGERPTGVWRLDTATQRVTHLDLAGLLHESRLSDLAASPTAVWVTSQDGFLLRIDPASVQVTERIPLGFSPGVIAAGRNDVWVFNVEDGKLVRVDARANRLAGSVDVPALQAVVATDDALWVASGTVWLLRIDPARVN